MSMPEKKIFTAKELVHHLRRTGKLVETSRVEDSLREFDEALKYVKGARGTFERFKVAALEHSRSIEAFNYISHWASLAEGNKEIKRSDEERLLAARSLVPMALYEFFCAVRFVDTQEELIRVSKKMGEYAFADFVTTEFQQDPEHLKIVLKPSDFSEEFREYFGGEKITIIELLQWATQSFVEDGKKSLNSTVFKILCEGFMRQILRDNDGSFFYRHQILFSVVEDSLIASFRQFSSNRQILDRIEPMGLMMCEFYSALMEAIVDPDDDRHEWAKSLFSLMLIRAKDLGVRFENTVILGCINRAQTGRIEDISWFRSFQQNAEFEEDEWYRQTFDLLFTVISKYSREDNLPIIWSTHFDRTAEACERLQIADQATVPLFDILPLLGTLPEGVFVKIDVNAQVAAEDVGKNDIHEFTVSGRMTDGWFVGRLVVNGVNFRQTILFSIDVENNSSEVLWNIVDPENISPHVKTVLTAAITAALYQYFQETERERQVKQEERSSVQTQTGTKREIQVTVRQKGPREMQPAPHKRAARKQAQAESENKAYERTLREQRHKPLFVLESQNVDKVLVGFDQQTKALILKKLANQRRGTSKVKTYANEVGPNGRPVHTIRVNRAIRIYAEMSEYGNVAYVYKVKRKP